MMMLMREVSHCKDGPTYTCWLTVSAPSLVVQVVGVSNVATDSRRCGLWYCRVRDPKLSEDEADEEKRLRLISMAYSTWLTTKLCSAVILRSDMAKASYPKVARDSFVVMSPCIILYFWWALAVRSLITNLCYCFGSTACPSRSHSQLRVILYIEGWSLSGRHIAVRG